MKNVLFVVLDSARRDRFSPYADDVGFTEHIDELADRGTVYEDAVAQSGWTLPSHASMFTGLYPWEHGATQETLQLQDDGGELLAERFQDAGYYTACFTSNTFVSNRMGLTAGFDEERHFLPVEDAVPRSLRRVWDRMPAVLRRRITVAGFTWARLMMRLRGNPGTVTPDAVEAAERVIAEEDDWFVFLNLMDAHEPVVPPAEYRDRHDAVDPDSIEHSAADHVSGNVQIPWEEYGRLYDAAVDYMDDMVGRLVDAVAAEDDLEDTVIVVVGDHGEHLGEDGFAGHMLSVSEHLVRVPLIIADPEQDSGTVAEQVELRGLADKLPSAAGLTEEPADMSVEVAKGGLAWPETQIRSTGHSSDGVDEDDLYARRRFVRTASTKVEKKETEDDVVYRAQDLCDGSSVAVPDRLRIAVDAIGAADGQVASLQEEDAAVKHRLEELGYL